MNERRADGRAVEEAALAHLETEGLRLLARNVSCRMGEVDLVMRDGAAVVFVEVRYRRDASHGGAAASVDFRKQRRLVAAARWYLAVRPALANAPCRFDVVAASGEAPWQLQWIRNAFQPAA